MADCEHDLRFQGLTLGGNAVCMICKGIRQGRVKELLALAEGSHPDLVVVPRAISGYALTEAAYQSRVSKNMLRTAWYRMLPCLMREAAAYCRAEAAKLAGEGDDKTSM
jgi:hypothetical protein